MAEALISPIPPLPPLALGETRTDPVFGTPYKRISVAAPGRWIGTEYPTRCAFNSLNTYWLLLEVDHFALYGPSGRVKDLTIGASERPCWDLNDFAKLYFLRGNVLYQMDVTTGDVQPIKTFGEYTAIDNMGEGDLSENGRCFALCGDGREVFLYDFMGDKKSPVLDISGLGPQDSIYVTPDNNVTMSSETPGAGAGQGIWLYDGATMKPLRQLALSSSHMDVTRDANGDEVLVRTNSNDSPALDGCPNGIEKIRLADGSKTCLLTLPWSLAVHVTAPLRAGFVVVETYPAVDVPYGCELVRVGLDGSTARLLQHRSNVTGYLPQPKASISRDAERLAFSSNMADPTNPNYCDVYLATLDAPKRTIPSRPGGARGDRQRGETR